MKLLLKQAFLGLALLLVSAVLAPAQSVNNVTVPGSRFTVTAAAGDSQCVFTGPNIVDSGTITCAQGKVIVLFTLWHAALTKSSSGSWDFPEHTISWVLTHVSAGSTNKSFTWSISIDGGPAQTGTF